MKKIPTLFRRDDQTHQVTPDVTPGCEWVIAGEGTPTVKHDGTCCMVRGGRLYKRRELKPGATAANEDFEAVMTDEVTGKTVGWLPVGEGPEDKSHREAMEHWATEGPPPDGTYELLGPKVQGNPEGFQRHSLIRHGSIERWDAPRDFDGLRSYLAAEHIEGIVFHHEDGRMAKIKAKDFGLRRAPVPSPVSPPS